MPPNPEVYDSLGMVILESYGAVGIEGQGTGHPVSVFNLEGGQLPCKEDSRRMGTGQIEGAKERGEEASLSQSTKGA